MDATSPGPPPSSHGASSHGASFDRARGNLHQRIARDLGERIAAGDPVPGKILPTEAELCASLAVSRSALREGFRLLAGKGLIASKRKVGTVVRPRAKWNMFDADVLAWHLATAPTDGFVTDLFEVRRIIEPWATALAAQRADAPTIARIGAAYEDMVRFQGKAQDLLEADLRFHETILEATGNAFLISFGALIESALRASFELSWSGSAHTPEHSLRRHRRVFETIRERRAQEAFALMSELLRSAIEDVHDALLGRRLSAGGEREFFAGHAHENIPSPARRGGPAGPAAPVRGQSATKRKQTLQQEGRR
ncbi:MAG TPA: FadR/GntR family transcriptional regulator [Acetobacteraceae bacterium]|nr:FadR/GntR family transcriptional regulator [Acetobacteraceae bacterium]